MKTIILLLAFLAGCASLTPIAPSDDANATDASFTDDYQLPEASSTDNFVPQEALPPYDAYNPSVCYIDYDGGYPWSAKVKEHVSTTISLGSSVALGYPYGKSITSDQVRDLVSTTLVSNQLAYDPNGIYVVLTSSDVSVDAPDGFCASYCAWHNSATIAVNEAGSALVRYAFVGDVSACPTTCDPFILSSGYAMVNPLAHELAETATDPDPYSNLSWIDNWFPQEEIADKCAWSFGDVYTQENVDAGSSVFNVQLGERKFLIQQLWAINSSFIDHCAVGVRCSPGFSGDAGYATLQDTPNEVDPIEYYGGQVLSQPITVHFIWYGSFSGTDETADVLGYFVSHLGGSPWWGLVGQYFDEPKVVDAGTEGGEQ